MKKILNFGSMNLDYVYAVESFVRPGETLAVKKLDVNCGGKGLNQSVAAARAGGEVYHAGAAGNGGEMLLDFLTESGVDTAYVKKVPCQNGHAIIQVDASGGNCILLYSGSNGMISEECIDEVLENFGEGDYLMAQNEISCVPYLLKRARERGMTVVFNPSPVTNDIDTYPLDCVSLFLVNEIEGKTLAACSDEEKIPEIIYEKYGASVVLTLGERGSIYYDGKNTYRAEIYKTKAVDTTGAGDTFTGYFVASLCLGLSPSDAMKRASVAAGISVSRSGAAVSIPSADEVDKIK